MAFVPAEWVLQCEARWTLAGQQVENVTYWLTPDPPDASHAAVIAQEYEDAFVAHMQSVTSADMSLRELYFTDLTTETSPTFTVIPGATVAGTSVSPGLPNSISFVVSFRTNGRGRSSRGRNYVMGLTEVGVTANTVLDGTANAAVAMYAQWRASCAANTILQVVISRREGGADRTVALIQPVTAILYTDQTVDSQRRRLPGRGS